MKLNKLVIGGGVLVVLLSMLVVGCKQNEELSVEEHREGANAYQHVWKAEYNNDTYTRSALQFGSGNLKVNHAEVLVEMDYPANGKAGLLFAVNDRKTGEGENKKTVYDFYAFAFGKDPNNEKKLEFYVDYYQGLESFNDTSSNSEQFGTGKYVTIVAPTPLDMYQWDGATPVELKMIIDRQETISGENEKSVTYNLSIENPDGGQLWSETGVTVVGQEGELDPALVVNEGNIYSYGMLSQKVTNPKKVDTTWTIDEKSFNKDGGSMLAAEDAE